MGQFHSTSQASSDASEQQGQKTDYYELLGVTRAATDDEYVYTLSGHIPRLKNCPSSQNQESIQEKGPRAAPRSKLWQC
jgi:hypothetical protein